MKKFCTILLLIFGIEAHAQLPPDQFLNVDIGADKTLIDWQQITDYLNYISRNSARISARSLGATTLGKPLIIVTISSPGNLRRVPEILEAQKKYSRIVRYGF